MKKILTVFDKKNTKLPVWGLDFETFYEADGEYTLRKMTAVEYIRDARFKAHGVAVQEPNGFSYWVTHKDLPYFFKNCIPKDIAFLAHNCLTGDHEALTPDGWKRLDELDGTEQIAQWDSVSGEASFTNYIPIKHNFTGYMLEYDSLYHKGIYTPDHRIYYKHYIADTFKVKTAAEASKLNRFLIPTAASQIKDAEKTVEFEDAFVCLLEAIRADGSWLKDNSNSKIYGCRFKFSKEKKVKRLLFLLNQCNISYNETSSRQEYKKTQRVFNIWDRQFIKKALLFLSEKKEFITSQILSLSSRQQKLLINELKYWDGHSRINSKTVEFFSANEKCIDDVQALCVLNGFTYKKNKEKNGFGIKDNVLFLFKSALRNINHIKEASIPKKVKHDGQVYCVTVPTSAFIVRRKGVTWITGNCGFDALICSEHYDYIPAYYLDTMSMSRGEFGSGVGASLEALTQRLGHGGKIQGSLEDTSGIRDLTSKQEGALVPYAINDIEKTLLDFETIYFDRAFPEKELHIIDLTIRAYAQPLLRVNAGICRAEIENEDIRMKRLLESDLVQGAELSPTCQKKLREGGIQALMRSRPCFAELLKSRGIAPPMKPAKDSKTGEIKENEYTYAFAKNDIELITLGEDPRVSDLVAAWTGLKSTLRKTRAERMLAVTHNGTKPLPIPLNYCGGRTHRWSGGGGGDEREVGNPYNPQNLSSGRDGGGTRLREAIEAPKGFMVLSVDAAQVELRHGAWLAGEKELLEDFRLGRDPYSKLGSKIFGVPVSKTENEQYRFVGKEGELSLIFGVGAAKFHDTITTKYISNPKFNLSEDQFTLEDAQKTVDVYRALRSGVVNTWGDIRKYIELMCARSLGSGEYYKVFKIENERVLMPNDLYIYYRDIHWDWDKEKQRGEVKYKFKNEWTRIYHAKMFENWVQSIARTTTAGHAVEISKELPIVLLVHDEIVTLVRETEAEDARIWCEDIMSKPPSWAPDLPLAAEGKINPCYTK